MPTAGSFYADVASCRAARARSARHGRHSQRSIVLLVKRVTSAGWLALGAVLVGGGFTVGVAYWIFTLEDSGGPGFWEPPGFLSVALLGIGALTLGVGLLRKDRPDHQRAAKKRGDARDRPDSAASQTARTAPGGQTTQVANVTSESDVTIAPEQRNG